MTIQEKIKKTSSNGIFNSIADGHHAVDLYYFLGCQGGMVAICPLFTYCNWVGKHHDYPLF